MNVYRGSVGLPHHVASPCFIAQIRQTRNHLKFHVFLLATVASSACFGEWGKEYSSSCNLQIHHYTNKIYTLDILCDIRHFGWFDTISSREKQKSFLTSLETIHFNITIDHIMPNMYSARLICSVAGNNFTTYTHFTVKPKHLITFWHFHHNNQHFAFE